MISKKPILKVALPTPLRRLFDYLPPQDIDLSLLKPGIRVKVPFQSRILVGILWEVVAHSSLPTNKLKEALALLDENPLLPPDVEKLCSWAATYYQYALGETLAAAIPVLLRKGKIPTGKIKLPKVETCHVKAPMLNDHQQQAITAIAKVNSQFHVFLLDGITGSGKTEVYLQAIAHQLAQQKQVLVLVPEISLTPQTITRFRERFSVVIVTLHSDLSNTERLHAWLAAKSGLASIVIGTRSAVFTPFANLGLIIVDEEHDASFKQQDRFRYHARDLAIMRAQLNNVPIILGSATPSLESILNVEKKKYTCLHLPERAGNATLPQYELVDLKLTNNQEGLSPYLISNIKAHLQEGNQVMLFLNRRGFAPVWYCTQCAVVIQCKRCDANMVYHKYPEHLHCHHCDAQKKIPKHCQQCGAAELQPVGLGTQRLEAILAEHFPETPILRLDRDSTSRKGEMENLLTRIQTETKAILLGTQMLAKGHHFPNVTLVGVIDADGGLFSSDFRAPEQMGQLLLQVAGRAGRAQKPGKVLIQTRHPDHPLLQTLVNSGYDVYAKLLLADREKAELPPFSYYALLRAETYEVAVGAQFLTQAKAFIKSINEAIQLYGPVTALLAKRKGLHCQHLFIKATKRSVLQQVLRELMPQLESFNKSVKWTLDVDPIEM